MRLQSAQVSLRAQGAGADRLNFCRQGLESDSQLPDAREVASTVLQNFPTTGSPPASSTQLVAGMPIYAMIKDGEIAPAALATD